MTTGAESLASIPPRPPGSLTILFLGSLPAADELLRESAPAGTGSKSRSWLRPTADVESGLNPGPMPAPSVGRLVGSEARLNVPPPNGDCAPPSSPPEAARSVRARSAGETESGNTGKVGSG